MATMAKRKRYESAAKDLEELYRVEAEKEARNEGCEETAGAGGGEPIEIEACGFGVRAFARRARFGTLWP